MFNSKGEVIGVLISGDEIGSHFRKSDAVNLIQEENKGYFKDLEEWFGEEIETVINRAGGGDPHAQFTVASYLKEYLMENNYIMEADDKQITENSFLSEGLPLYREAAAQGLVESQILLGYIYLHGVYGVPQDIEYGIKWLRLAVKQSKNLNRAHLELGRALIINYNGNARTLLEGLVLLKQLEEGGVKPVKKLIEQLIPEEGGLRYRTADEIMEYINKYQSILCGNQFSSENS